VEQPFDSVHARRIAFVVHPDRPAAHDLAKSARAFWESRGYEVIEDSTVGGPQAELAERELDLVVSLGGDGTMLRSAQFAAPRGLPVLGVNLGALGYLTQVEPSGLERAFERLLVGDYEIEQRMTLDVALTRRSGVTQLCALNDAVVEKTAQGHTMRLQLSVNGENFLTYVADGFLVSTPSGSTAYNLSLRGPIVSPRTGAIICTPISPHMLFDRSLVLDPSESVAIEIMGDRSGLLVVDGLSALDVEPGDEIAVRAGRSPVRMVSFGESDFYRVLRLKFGLADR
jgi:NAD+ kinase